MGPSPFGYLPLAAWGGTFAGRARMRTPVRLFIPHHSVTNEDIGVNATESAIDDFRELDAIGRSRGHRGISYPWAIHPQGVIGEGQGLYVGAHTLGYNTTALAVVFVGNYDIDTLDPRAVLSFRWLRDALLEMGALQPGLIYPECGHNCYFATGCPGVNIKNNIGTLRVPYAAPHQEEELVNFTRPVVQSYDKVARQFALVPRADGSGSSLVAFYYSGADFTSRQRAPLDVGIALVPGTLIDFSTAKTSSVQALTVDGRSLAASFTPGPGDPPWKFKVSPDQPLPSAGLPAGGPGGGGLSAGEVKALIREELDSTRLAPRSSA